MINIITLLNNLYVCSLIYTVVLTTIITIKPSRKIILYKKLYCQFKVPIIINNGINVSIIIPNIF